MKTTQQRSAQQLSDTHTLLSHDSRLGLSHSNRYAYSFNSSPLMLHSSSALAACPCAACKGETNVLSQSAPLPQNFTPASFELRSWQWVGGYAIQPHWGDGHASGIYTFEYLRKLETLGKDRGGAQGS